MMTTTEISKADRIVSKHTAFATYLDLAVQMNRGYVPTVSRRRQPSLLRLLRSLGREVFEVR